MQVHRRGLRRKGRDGGECLERIHTLPGVEGRKLGEDVRFHSDLLWVDEWMKGN